MHSGGRRVWSSPTRSTVVHPSRRSCGCLTQSHTRCTQSALDATPFQEPWQPARGNSPDLVNEQHSPKICRFSFMILLKLIELLYFWENGSEYQIIIDSQVYIYSVNSPVPQLASDKLNSSPLRTFELPVGSGLTGAAPACCPMSRQTRSVPGGRRAAAVLSPLEWRVQLAGRGKIKMMDGTSVFGILILHESTYSWSEINCSERQWV